MNPLTQTQEQRNWWRTATFVVALFAFVALASTLLTMTVLVGDVEGELAAERAQNDQLRRNQATTNKVVDDQADAISDLKDTVERLEEQLRELGVEPVTVDVDIDDRTAAPTDRDSGERDRPPPSSTTTSTTSTTSTTEPCQMPLPGGVCV